MAHLLVVSLIWAFSFGLIKGNLQGLDPSFVSWVRMTLSLLVFLPFLRPAQMKWRQAWQLIVLGGVQYGLMYVFYIASFETLKAHQVALSTVLTPLFVVGLEAWTTRTLRARFALAALLAVGGAALLNPDPTCLARGKACCSCRAPTSVSPSDKYGTDAWDGDRLRTDRVLPLLTRAPCS
ncbi:MAG TPA: DMT family transporter [Polyangiaceae bacterium]|nr:DMT family transporter [Polyangiaceae bacterium]